MLEYFFIHFILIFQVDLHFLFKLLFHNGMTNNEQDYDICFRMDNIVLPKNGYFGISAATGMHIQKKIQATDLFLYK